MKNQTIKDLLFLNIKKTYDTTHPEQIKLMIINNSAHKLYISKKLKYNKIVDYIMKEISNKNYKKKLNSFDSILKYISDLNNHYKTYV